MSTTCYRNRRITVINPRKTKPLLIITQNHAMINPMTKHFLCIKSFLMPSPKIRYNHFHVFYVLHMLNQFIPLSQKVNAQNQNK